VQGPQTLSPTPSAVQSTLDSDGAFTILWQPTASLNVVESEHTLANTVLYRNFYSRQMKFYIELQVNKAMWGILLVHC